jgi:hypothetical protein
MKQKLDAKFPIFQGAAEKIYERRERKNMKHCFTWIGLICLVMFSVNADATTPFADDLPDLRLAPQGSSSFPKSLDPAFDLDDYVIDNNQSDDVLSWSSAVETNGPLVNIDDSSAQPALHEVEYMEDANQGLFDVTYTVDDGVDGTDNAVSTVKYSTFFVTEPKFTADNRLSFKGPNKPRFTYVKMSAADGDSAESTPALLPYLVSDLGTGTPFSNPGVSFGPLLAYDLTTGSPVKVAEGNTIDILGALDAQVLTPSGVVYLTPKNALSCAVLISIPAVLDTFNATGNWDGTVIMVAPAKRITTYPAQVAIFGENPQQVVNTRFENIPAGAALQPGGAGVSGVRSFITGGWRLDPVGTLPTGTVSLLTAAQLASTVAGNAANQFAGATSGNCLQLDQNNVSGTQVMFTNLNCYDITPALPGEVYGISMNIATDVPASAIATIGNKVQLQLQIQTKPDNGIYQQTVVTFDQGTAGLGTFALPTDGKWRQVYTEFIVPKLNQSVDGLYNMMPNGFYVNIRVQANAGCPRFRMFIDNVYVYNKGMSDINVSDVNGEVGGLVEKGLANGVTALPELVNRVNPEVDLLIDPSFESGSTLTDNGWVDGGKPGYVKAAWYAGTSTVSVEPSGRLQSSGSVAAQVGRVVPSTESDGIRFRTKGIALNGAKDDGTPIAGAVDYSGESYWGLTFWVTSGAADITQNPEVKVVLQEIRPVLNQMINGITVGPSAIPAGNTANEWYQYSLVGAYPDLGLGRAMQAALVEVSVVSVGNRQGFVTPAPYDGTTKGKPGSVGTARVYLDDFVIHKVRDLDTYWNASLFE